MATSKVLPMDERKSEMCSIRLTTVQQDYINSIMKIIQEQRGPGAKRVTKTEVILICLTIGIEHIIEDYKSLKPKRKKEVS